METSDLRANLINIINKFGYQLTNAKYNQYIPKLRDYLIPYILDKKAFRGDIRDLFEFEFTKSDVVNSTIYYIVENDNVVSKSAIDDFLIALNALYLNVINKEYPNNILKEVQPFIKLNNQIEEKIINEKIKDLKSKDKFPSIEKDEYISIIDYLDKFQTKSIKSYQEKILIKLLLLYGFSFDKLIDLKVTDYCEEKGILSVPDHIKGRKFHLELPYELNNTIKEYLKIRDLEKYEIDNFFVTREDSKITNSYLSDILKKLKDEYICKNKELDDYKNKFTPTGLAKYAVINMISIGMNESIIRSLTDFSDAHFEDCQDIVNEIKNLNRNRYVNHMIRGISTYDDI